MNEFRKARFTLTGWYIAISIILLIIFNLFAIEAERRAFNRIQEVVSDRTERPRLTALLEERINRFEGNFLETLFVFDTVMLLGASFASYFLSGRTLKPIEEMVKKQQEFAADASHELRTPLTTIGMEIEALEQTEKAIPKRYQEVLVSIKEEAARMRKLVDGLLTLVRIDVNSKANLTLFSLKEQLWACGKQMQSVAKQKNIALTTKKAEDANIFGDREQIKQVLLILLDNAVKYTAPGGKITLSLTTNKHQAFVTVSDTGYGIDVHDVPHIFERFFRGTNKEGGIGLGLTIAKQIVAHHKGKITVQSTHGEGSTFTVALPLHS